MLAATAGLLSALAFPRWEGLFLEPLAWCALVPLLIALERRQRPWWCCFAFAITYQLTQVLPLMVLLGPWVGALLVNTVGIWLLPASYVLLRSRLITGWALAAWVPMGVVLEWAQTTLLATNAPWWALGASQARLLPEIQFIHSTGMWGLTGWLLLLNALVCWALRQRHPSPQALAQWLLVTAVIALPWTYGAWHMAQADQAAVKPSESLRVGAIGSGLPEPGTDRIPLALRASEAAIAQSPDVLIWPEGVNVPGMPNTPSMRNPLQHSVALWRTPLLLVGTQFRMYDQDIPHTAFSKAIAAPYEARTGSVWLTPEQQASENALFMPKQHLVPFQEGLPAAETLPWLAALMHPLAQHGRAHWFTASRNEELQLPQIQQQEDIQQTITIAPLLCFEILFPATLAQRVRQGAHLVVWQTNDEDAHAGHYAYQFAQFARLRAVETGRDIVRVNTDGDHLHIDARGRTVAQLPRSAGPSHTVFTVPAHDELTLAARAPHAFLVACAVAALAFMGWGWRSRLQSSKSANSGRP
jgi:apolipoprotein N-acyltransferase